MTSQELPFYIVYDELHETACLLDIIRSYAEHGDNADWVEAREIVITLLTSGAERLRTARTAASEMELASAGRGQ